MSRQYGLVVCGGLSSRMGTDKSMLNYHGKPQRYYLYELLSVICEKVFISCNEEQNKTIPSTYNVIIDKPEYAETGPMAALLSAFDQHPNCSFLVVGCDYPFIDIPHLKRLLLEAKEEQYGASFYDNDSDFYEPLLSDYHNTTKYYLQQQFNNKNYSIQSVLKRLDIKKVVPESSKIIKSIDTKEAYKQAKRELGNS